MAGETRTINDLMNEFISHIDVPEGGSIDKTASHPDGEDMARKIESAGDTESKTGDGVKPTEDQESVGSGSPNTTGKEDALSPSKEDTGDQPSEPSGEHNKSKESRTENKTTEVKDGKNKSPNEKTAEEVDTAEILKAIENEVSGRYGFEDLLKSAAEETLADMYKDITKTAEEKELSQLTRHVRSRVKKSASADNKTDEEEPVDTKKDTSDKKETDESSKSGEKSSGGSPVESENKTEKSESEEVSESVEGAPQGDTASFVTPVPAGAVSGEVDIEGQLAQLPEEVQTEINALVDDITGRLQELEPNITREEVLIHLNDMSQEALGKLSEEDFREEVVRSSKQAEAMQLAERLSKLSADLDAGIPPEGIEDTAVEPPVAPESEPAAPESEPAAGTEEPSEEDAMAASVLQNLGEDQIAALQQAVAELEEQGVPQENIADAVKAVLLTENPDESIPKVSSEDEFNQLGNQDKVKYYVFYSLVNSTGNQNG